MPLITLFGKMSKKTQGWQFCSAMKTLVKYLKSRSLKSCRYWHLRKRARFAKFFSKNKIFSKELSIYIPPMWYTLYWIKLWPLLNCARLKEQWRFSSQKSRIIHREQYRVGKPCIEVCGIALPRRRQVSGVVWPQRLCLLIALKVLQGKAARFLRFSYHRSAHIRMLRWPTYPQFLRSKKFYCSPFFLLRKCHAERPMDLCISKSNRPREW